MVRSLDLPTTKSPVVSKETRIWTEEAQFLQKSWWSPLLHKIVSWRVRSYAWKPISIDTFDDSVRSEKSSSQKSQGPYFFRLQNYFQVGQAPQKSHNTSQPQCAQKNARALSCLGSSILVPVVHRNCCNWCVCCASFVFFFFRLYTNRVSLCNKINKLWSSWR